MLFIYAKLLKIIILCLLVLAHHGLTWLGVRVLPGFRAMELESRTCEPGSDPGDAGVQFSVEPAVPGRIRLPARDHV
jgi:hypothetical protein